MMTRRGIIILVASVILDAFFLADVIFFGASLFQKTQVPAFPSAAPASDIAVFAENLSIPWEIAFLPDGDMLVTERPGTVKRIGKNKRTYTISGVAHRGEGGLLGLAIHPRFIENRWIYLYLTTRHGDSLVNRVERYRLADDALSERTEIITNIPGASIHDGGRIAFSPDGFLFITTGDANQSKSAQDKNSLAGKILRIRDDGSIPTDNPFGNAVWTYGHRNPQGLAWDDRGRLWATEHGRSIPLSGYDEINLIEKGKNYGWPDIQGDSTKTGMEKPVIHSGPYDTWAPAGAAFAGGSIFFGGLKGEALYELPVSGDDVGSLKKHLSETFGRIRAVAKGPDGLLYISTSNTDGRGTPHLHDDKIISIDPTALESR
ncbi:MAG: PQQ-dependent sugar dehydrogenase [Patescibacteria group bacterium]